MKGARNSVSLEFVNLKEVQQMFDTLPKRVNQKTVWRNYWKKVSEPSKRAAQILAPVAKEDIPYPPNKSLTIKRGTLRDSIQFFQTKASNKPWFHGAYVGPRVKGKYRKNKGGYYGAWLEYGGSVKHFGEHTSKDLKFMERAWKGTLQGMKSNGIKNAAIIFDKEVKKDLRRINKYGLGY